MVRGSLEHETDRGVYRKRILHGTCAKLARDEVRTAVLNSLRYATRSHEDAAEAGAVAADHALARVGVRVERIGTERIEWRGRLAHVLLLLEQDDASLAATALRELVNEIPI